MLKPKKIITLSTILFIINIQSQTIDIDYFAKGQAFTLGGSVSTTFTYLNGNRPGIGLHPYTYMLSGNLTFGLYQFSMPVSYSYSNMGEQFNYSIPFNFNRLSLHPKYKWITAHIGDVSMNFSPYTLNGHQFTGGGLELSPKGGWKFSVMAGRLLKATEDDGDKRSIPAFKRMGYGTKIAYNKSKYQVEFSGFYAKDEIHSISSVPEEKKVLPQENLSLSLKGKMQVLKDLQAEFLYASSALTQDLRTAVDKRNTKGLTGLFFPAHTSTQYYNAYKVGLSYKISNTNLRLVYEHIDPGYTTLGAYYFNNDLENISINATQPLFHNKLNLNFNIGYQRDNLNMSKLMSTNRMVGAFNFQLQAGKKISLSGSYSNFSTYTNEVLNRLDEINNIDPVQTEINRFNYKQLSQNANLNFTWNIKRTKKKTQNFNLTYSLASTINEQGGVVLPGQQSNFHNAVSSYQLGFPQQKLNFSASLNYIFNDMEIGGGAGLGGVLSVSKRLMDNKLNLMFSTAYNSNQSGNIKTQVANARIRLGYSIKKHQLNIMAVQLFKTSDNRPNLNEFRMSFGYNYSFDILKKKEQSQNKTKSISKEITRKNIEKKKKPVSKAKKEDKISNKTIEKLPVNRYKKFITKSLDILQKESINADEKIVKEYMDAEAKYNSSSSNKLIKEEYLKKKNLYDRHKWILKELNKIDQNSQLKDSIMDELIKNNVEKLKQLQASKAPKKEIISLLEIELLKLLNSKYDAIHK